MKLAFVLLALVAAVCGQQEPWCRCGAFITFDDDEAMVYEMPEVTIDSCENHKQCKNSCTKEMNNYSHYGDLWAMTPLNKTVGQAICETLTGLSYDFVHNHYVYGYYEVCGGPWEYTGIASKGMLCCNDGLQEHCIN
ncbi:uncharacterized protein LOC135208217 [Macrobrachium nipponense]|uniref:uncharacterized protein LOC135208217 n=1 Tax=Macrobrachium nipponense TaxID=159736 RepID=UPI0030C810E9